MTICSSDKAEETKRSKSSSHLLQCNPFVTHQSQITKNCSLRWLETFCQHLQKQNLSTAKAARLGDWRNYALIQKNRLVFNCKKKSKQQAWSFSNTYEPMQCYLPEVLNNLVASYELNLIPLLPFNLRVRNLKAPDDSNLCHHCGPCAVWSQVRTAVGKAGGARGKFQEQQEQKTVVFQFLTSTEASDFSTGLWWSIENTAQWACTLPRPWIK